MLLDIVDTVPSLWCVGEGIAKLVIRRKRGKGGVRGDTGAVVGEPGHHLPCADAQDATRSEDPMTLFEAGDGVRQYLRAEVEEDMGEVR